MPDSIRASGWAGRWLARLSQVAAAVCLAWVFLLITLVGLSQFVQDHGTRPKRNGATSAIVFYTEAEPARTRRLELALKLWREQHVQPVVLVGGWRPGSGFNGAREMADWLTARGVPRSSLLFDAASNDTVSNIESARRLLEQNPADAHLLVSDRLHLLRIMLLARARSPDAEWLPAPTSEPSVSWATLGRAHHEALAWASYLLPHELRRHLLAGSRNEHQR